MNSRTFKSAILAAAVIGFVPITGAQAQWYSSYPHAPAGANPSAPYAIEVAPNTYVIHRPTKRDAVEQLPADRPRTHAKRELIEELAKRNNKRKDIQTVTVNTKKIVRGKPVVIEHERVVDDPPRVIERRHITEDAPGRGIIKKRREVATEDVVIDEGGSHRDAKRSIKSVTKSKQVVVRENGRTRVIKAEAEVTILGPDRMSIRLFRKGRDANAEVAE